jgi:polysaccharide biosynthesis transport protein
MHQHATNKPGSTSSSTSFDPWLLWVAFRKHWGWVVPVGAILAAIGALAVWSTFVPEYEATHILEVNRDFVISQSVGQVPGDLATSERQLITNAIVLDQVLADERLHRAPSLADSAHAEREIRRRLSVGNAGTDNLLTISYRDSDKEMAAMVCNAVAEAYLGVRARFDDTRMGNVEGWLRQPIEQWKLTVQDLRANLARLTKDAKGYDPFKENSSLTTENWRISSARSSLASLEAEETVLIAQLQVLESTDDGVVKPNADLNPVAVESIIDSDPQVQKLRGSLRDTEEKIRQLEYKELHKMWAERYKAMQDDAARIQAELLVAEAKAGDRALDIMAKSETRKLAASREQGIKDLNLKLLSLRAQKDAFRNEYESEKARLEKLGGETADIFFAREDYEQAAEILGLLNNRLAILRTERGRGSSISTMAPAKTPSWPIEEVPWKKIGLAAVGAFLFPFALAVLLEFRIKRLTHANALEQNNLAPIMGEIARIPGGPKTSRSHRLFEESVDALRANLLFKLEGVRSIAVTSAMSAEGKSSVASQLAISLAKTSGSTVLLIDADLRSPDQHALFGLNNENGLCKYLSGTVSIQKFIDRSLGDLVHVLPAGRLATNPHNLLTIQNMKRLLADLSTTYQYIVVDTSPVLPAAESLAVAASCDATLFCAMRDISRVEHMQRTLRRLEATGANVIGTVFSGVPAREYAYRYGDYRYSHAKLDSSQAI